MKGYCITLTRQQQADYDGGNAVNWDATRRILLRSAAVFADIFETTVEIHTRDGITIEAIQHNTEEDGR